MQSTIEIELIAIRKLLSTLILVTASNRDMRDVGDAIKAASEIDLWAENARKQR